MWNPTLNAGWTCLILAFATAAPVHAQEDITPTEPPQWLVNTGLSLGGGYATNLYQNASAVADSLALAKLSLGGAWLPTPTWSFKLTYQGDGELNRNETQETHWGHGGELSAGYRPIDALFVMVALGMEQAAYTSNAGQRYNFWGAYGRAGGRLELGDSSTARLDYRYREDRFPEYDLDNRSHQLVGEWDQGLGDTFEIRLPVTYESTYYSERYLADSSGVLTAKHRTGQRFQAEPMLVFLPSYDLRMTLGVRGELNRSNDTYYYPGPFGRTATSVAPSLIANYDSYQGGAASLSVRWDALDSLTTSAKLEGGARRYEARPAFDAYGLDTGDLEQDRWLLATAELRWRFSDLLGVNLSYRYLLQQSNDALWDFDAHRVDAYLETTWGN